MNSLALTFILLLSSSAITRHVAADVFSSAAQLNLLFRAKQQLEETLGLAPDRNAQLNVQHPVDAFHLIRQWHKMANQYPTVLQQILAQGNIQVPSETDERGAAQALMRLQRTYDIGTQDLAKGEVLGHRSASPMSSDDCYLLASTAMERKDYGLAAQWFQQTIRQQQQTTQRTRQTHRQQQATFQLSDVYFQLSQALSEIGDYAAALKAAETATDQAPSKVNWANWKRLRQQVEKMSLKQLQKAPNMTTWKRTYPRQWLEEYELLCRGGKVDKAPSVRRPLVCRFKPGALPYVGYKEEVMSWDPRISLFHDVIADSEIERVKRLALPQLARATIGIDLKSDERTSKVSWLWDYDCDLHAEGDFIKGLSMRVADITGLDTTIRHDYSSAEGFQVLNYGIGGHYEPHYDYTPSKPEDQPFYLTRSGERIITFMFYLSDIAEGGATVFPIVGARVPPVKGGAAFWYNLTPSGETDPRTLHAGCPVLVGEKWVANKWVHQLGQEFRARCPPHKHAVWNV